MDVAFAQAALGDAHEGLGRFRVFRQRLAFGIEEDDEAAEEVQMDEENEQADEQEEGEDESVRYEDFATAAPTTTFITGSFFSISHRNT